MKKTQLKYYLLIFLFVFFLSGTWDHIALAYSIDLTVEAIEDGGLIPRQDPFARFDKKGSSDVLHVVPTNPPPGSQWDDKADVVAYIDPYLVEYATKNNLSKLPDWWLWSAGNIWSQTDTIVGESLTGLSAGTYRISPVDGAFRYDSFGWSPNVGDDLYRWQLHIQARSSTGSLIGSDQILGSTSYYSTAALALSASLGEYVDITLPDGGSLVFWIWDWNSLDNAGSLDFNVTQIPEPTTFVLLGTGILFLMKRFRKSSPLN